MNDRVFPNGFVFAPFVFLVTRLIGPFTPFVIEDGLAHAQEDLRSSDVVCMRSGGSCGDHLCNRISYSRKRRSSVRTVRFAQGGLTVTDPKCALCLP